MFSRLGPPHSTTSPVGEHGFDAEDVVGRHAVFEAVRAAGVEGDVAANRADQGAGGIGRVMEAVRRGGQRYLGVHHAGLHHGNPLGGVETQICGSGD